MRRRASAEPNREKDGEPWPIHATTMNLKTAVGRSDGLAVCDFSRFGCISLARGGEARGAGGR